MQDSHLALLTKYEKTFDLTTVKEAAEAAGMKKPSSGQISYIDLSGPDTAVVYAANEGSVISRCLTPWAQVWARCWNIQMISAI